MTTPNIPNEGVQQRYDNDDDGLHPDDVLITKWFPECTTLELLDRRPERYDMHRAARAAEADIKNGIHRVPPQVPWPKPPPRPRCELEVGIEEWRQPRLRMLDHLIAQWKAVNKNHARYNGIRAATVTTSKSSQPKPQCTSKAHRALHIAEILEMIVDLLDPESMLTLRAVSTTLRATVTVVLGLQYRKNYPCGPIEYYEEIPQDLNWMQPTAAEIAELELNIHNRSIPGFRSRDQFVYPARITQAQCLSNTTCIATRNLWNSHINSFVHNIDWVPYFPLDTSDNRWLDLSQIQINPYLSHCFGHRAQEIDGRLEIKLLSSPNCITRSPFVTLGSLSSLVRPMYATQPPCKSLGIYVHYADVPDPYDWIRRIATVEAEDGVRIGQLADALDQHSATVVDSWLEDVTSEREIIAGRNWQDYSLTTRPRREGWMNRCEVGPKILVLFDGPRPESHKLCLAETIYGMKFSPENFNRLSREWRDAFAQWSEREPDSGS